jgi:hypothetical protein
MFLILNLILDLILILFKLKAMINLFQNIKILLIPLLIILNSFLTHLVCHSTLFSNDTFYTYGAYVYRWSQQG